MTNASRMTNAKTTFAILTDLHYGTPSPIAKRRSDIADILLRRAVHRLNRLIKPDVTLVLGDLVDNGDAPSALEHLEHLNAILDKLDSPTIVIPGNHDGDVEAFYRVFERPKAIEEIAGVRFLPFIDREEPGYNASRSETDIARFREARSEYDGPIVALQHVCLSPPDRANVPYNYTNAQAIVDAMAEAGVALSISGHHHAGARPLQTEHTTFVTAPALCEAPFGFLVVTLDDDRVTTERHQLAMPERLHLVDRHIHTQLAYCAENMTVERTIALAQDFGLAGIGFAEHSGQLYFDRTKYWSRDSLRESIAGAKDEDNRMPDYLVLKRAFAQDGVQFGLEVDGDFHGGLLLKPEDRHHADFLVGSIHSTPSIKKPDVALETVKDEFVWMLERLLHNEIDILAHPFRIFRRDGWLPPDDLFQPVTALLREHHVAAEINFHTNEPPLDFVRACLEAGVRLAFSSDAHNLYEIGEFALHLKLLRDAGFDGDPTDVLWEGKR